MVSQVSCAVLLLGLCRFLEIERSMMGKTARWSSPFLKFSSKSPFKMGLDLEKFHKKKSSYKVQSFEGRVCIRGATTNKMYDM